MNPGDPTGTFCDCVLPDRRLEDGNLYCAGCGRQIPEARDQLLVTAPPRMSATVNGLLHRRQRDRPGGRGVLGPTVRLEAGHAELIRRLHPEE